MLPYSELRTTNRKPLAPRLPLKAPLGVMISLTNRCNLSCEFCPKSDAEYYKKVGGSADLDSSLVRKVIKELADAGLKSLRLYGIGEPLLHRGLESLIAY